MTAKDSNIDLLIQRQSRLIQQGGDASVLADLMKEQQFSIYRLDPLTQQQKTIYFSALVIANRFSQLKFAIERNAQNYNKQMTNLYYTIADNAITQNFTSLIQHLKQLQSKSNSEMKSQFIKSAKRYTLRKLSRDYLNIEAQFLLKSYQINEADLKENGCTVEGGYATLPVFKSLDGTDQLMERRIQQLSTITENVIKKANS